MIDFQAVILIATLGGKIAAVSVFILLIVLLMKLPQSVIQLLNEHQMVWWKRTRVWAIAIAGVQICVYLFFG